MQTPSSTPKKTRKLVSREPSGSSTDCASTCSSSRGMMTSEEFHSHMARKRSLSSTSFASSVQNFQTQMKRQRSSEESESPMLPGFSSMSVGKCPPRDMKRLTIGVPYEVTRVAKWGEKLAIFLKNSETGSDVGFFKPPVAYKQTLFHVGDKVILESIGYSSSRNRIAQRIRVDSSNAMCLNGCEGKYGPEGGCCTQSVIAPILEKKKQNQDLAVKSLSSELVALLSAQALNETIKLLKQSTNTTQVAQLQQQLQQLEQLQKLQPQVQQTQLQPQLQQVQQLQQTLLHPQLQQLQQTQLQQLQRQLQLQQMQQTQLQPPLQQLQQTQLQPQLQQMQQTQLQQMQQTQLQQMQQLQQLQQLQQRPQQMQHFSPNLMYQASSSSSSLANVSNPLLSCVGGTLLPSPTSKAPNLVQPSPANVQLTPLRNLQVVYPQPSVTSTAVEIKPGSASMMFQPYLLSESHRNMSESSNHSMSGPNASCHRKMSESSHHSMSPCNGAPLNASCHRNMSESSHHSMSPCNGVPLNASAKESPSSKAVFDSLSQAIMMASAHQRG